MLHRVGILNRDINNANIVKGLFLDLSCAWTTPHPCLSTTQIETLNDAYDQIGQTDAYGVDRLIDQWNKCHPFSQRIWDRMGASDDYRQKLRLHDINNPSRPDDGNNVFRRGYRLRPDKYRPKKQREGLPDMDQGRKEKAKSQQA